MLALMLVIPSLLVAASVYLRVGSRRKQVLPRWRSKLELAGILAIAVSFAFVGTAFVFPRAVFAWLLFSWKAAALFLLCVIGMVFLCFGRGLVRITGLLGGVATLALWYVLGMSP